MPGESQQIDRITETFADAFIESRPVEVANQEAAYVLAFSVIMLNTDQHNRQVRVSTNPSRSSNCVTTLHLYSNNILKHRMSFEQYKSNVRGINAGKDFSVDYLRAIYDAIRSDEIVMPEEHEGQLGFNFAWKQLLHRAKSAGLFTVCDTAAYDKDIFTLAWKPAVAAISYGKDDQRTAIVRGTKAILMSVTLCLQLLTLLKMMLRCKRQSLDSTNVLFCLLIINFMTCLTALLLV